MHQNNKSLANELLSGNNIPFLSRHYGPREFHNKVSSYLYWLGRRFHYWLCYYDTGTFRLNGPHGDYNLNFSKPRHGHFNYLIKFPLWTRVTSLTILSFFVRWKEGSTKIRWVNMLVIPPCFVRKRFTRSASKSFTGSAQNLKVYEDAPLMLFDSNTKLSYQTTFRHWSRLGWSSLQSVQQPTSLPRRAPKVNRLPTRMARILL